MTALDWAAKLLEERGREIADTLMQAIKGGGWRAAEALMNRRMARLPSLNERARADSRLT
jgi:hypothetical protein